MLQPLSYRRDVDGLRAVAVLAVVLYHAFPRIVPGGFVGVDVFFVISGYLISGQIFDHLAEGRFTFLGFYARRIRRIFPALIVVLAASYAFGYIELPADLFKQLGKHIAGGAGFAANFVLWQEAGYFDTNAALKPLLHLWSLGIEEQFYLLWPLFLVIAWRWRLSVPVILAVGAASFAFNLLAAGTDPVGAFYSPATRFWELMAGAALCRLGPVPPRRARALAISGLFVIMASAILIDRTVAFPGWRAVFPVIGTVAVLAARQETTLLSTRPFVAIGLISYPLYLWHWPLLVFARMFQLEPLSITARCAIIAASVVMATMTYLLIERPIRFGAMRPSILAPVLACVIAVVGVSGLGVYNQDGIQSRAVNLRFQRVVAPYADDLKTKDLVDSDPGPSCAKSLGLKLLPNEHCLTQSAAPDIMIVGDSHAISLNSAVQVGHVRLNTMLLAAAGCLPFESLLNHGPGDPGRHKNCGQIAEHALSVAKALPSVKTVVMNARDIGYMLTEITGPETDADRVGYSWIPDPKGGLMLDNEAALIDGYSRTISGFQVAGKRVVFLIDSPLFDLDFLLRGNSISRCVIPDLSGHVTNCTITRQHSDRFQRKYRAAVSVIKKRNPGLAVFDTVPLFCDASHCSPLDDRHLYFWDANHLSVSGSERVLKALAPLLQPNGD